MCLYVILRGLCCYVFPYLSLGTWVPCWEVNTSSSTTDDVSLLDSLTWQSPRQTSAASLKKLWICPLSRWESCLPKGQKVVPDCGLWPPMLMGAGMAVGKLCTFPGMGWVALTPSVSRSRTDWELSVCALIADLRYLTLRRSNAGTVKYRPRRRLQFDWQAHKGLFPSGCFCSYNLFQLWV